ncbi:MAG: murein L,D-transpeptidase [Candidatus Tectimicrobiota bacterium]|nr:MAG: murein L,D-transpeptidase [Candidatus Tectomicrobia bacterium]
MRWLLAIWLVVSVGFLARAQSLPEAVRERLRSRIEAAGESLPLRVGSTPLYATVVLPRFYERRGYWPAWSSAEGLLPRAEELVAAIRDAEREGLDPGAYHLRQLEALLAAARQHPQPALLTDLDLLLTDAFLTYGAHLLAGKVDPVRLDPEWHANRREADLAAVLQRALETDTISASLQALLPAHPGYAWLRAALARYRALAAAGGWPHVSTGPALRRGDAGPRVAALRRRLAATGDLPSTAGAGGDFDAALEEAVRRFQRRHGLEADGIVGAATLAALNVPAPQRVRQIALNLERWRWLPAHLGRRYVLVNIASFELEVVEEGRRVLHMRVVVGRDYRRTPVFSSTMTYLVLNPSWHVPPRIAVQDLLPLIQKDPTYLTRQGIRVLQGWGAETRELDPQRIDWSRVTAQRFPYRLRQDPGPQNALGRVKFMFPNPFNVYLHDTPARELFAKSERTFSSGCIRLEKALELAFYLLKDHPKWNRDTILEALARGKEQTVVLPQPIPVHLLYWTAWAEADGTVHFRRDIYGRDARLARALWP